MSRDAQSFSRKGARFKPQPRVLVLCEDTKSGKNYLEDAARYYRSFAVVEFSHCGHTDSIGIVQEAIKRQNDFEEIYCVLDRDSHPSWNAAFVLAKSNVKITIIPSYPCFEYWVLLHFEFTRAPFSSVGNHSAADRVLKDLRKKSGFENYEKGYKGCLFDDLFNNLDKARLNAIRSITEAESTQEKNPSTLIHELLDKFEELSKPKLKKV